MAEVSQDSGGGRGKKGGSKQSKKSTKVDMTAMVDVAFLLLTFFILTTTLAKPSAMELQKTPKTDNEEERTKDVAESKVMTLILGSDDKIRYYQGITDAVVKTTDFSKIRDVVEKHIKSRSDLCRDVGNTPGCWDPIFVIKPHKTSKYRNMVDILDEMRIIDAPKYALDDYGQGDSIIFENNNIRKP